MEIVDSLYYCSRSSFPSTRVSSHLLTRYGVSPMASMSSGIATEASHESTSSTYGSEQIQVNLWLVIWGNFGRNSYVTIIYT